MAREVRVIVEVTSGNWVEGRVDRVLKDLYSPMTPNQLEYIPAVRSGAPVQFLDDVLGVPTGVSHVITQPYDIITRWDLTDQAKKLMGGDRPTSTVLRRRGDEILRWDHFSDGSVRTTSQKVQKEALGEAVEKGAKEALQEGGEWLTKKTTKKVFSFVPAGGIIGEFAFPEEGASFGEKLARGIGSEISFGPIDITTVYDVFSSEFYWTELPKFVSNHKVSEIHIDGVDYSIGDDGTLVEKKSQDSEYAQELSAYCSINPNSMECF